MASDSRSSSYSEISDVPSIYTPEQIQKLEQFFTVCNSPGTELRRQWAMELGIEPDQINSWFKNKLRLTKVKEQKEENDALRQENARIFLENLQIREVLNNRPQCDCSKDKVLQDLQNENEMLREEYRRVTRAAAHLFVDPTLFDERGDLDTDESEEDRALPSSSRPSNSSDDE